MKFVIEWNLLQVVNDVKYWLLHIQYKHTLRLKTQKSKPNQIFHYTRCITPKREGVCGAHLSVIVLAATQLLSNKRRSGGEPLAKMCPILLARDLNLRFPAPETNALPIDLQAGKLKKLFVINISYILRVTVHTITRLSFNANCHFR